jgi:uncharacterized protein (DUF736 family)
MSERKAPWGKVYAVVPNLSYEDDAKRNPETAKRMVYLELGVAWLNRSQEGRESMRIQLHVTPVQWGDPNCPRIIDVQKNQERRGSR